MQAVTLARAVEEAADRHPGMTMAELVRHVVAEPLAGAGGCGAGEGPGEGEDGNRHERQRADKDDLAYTEPDRPGRWNDPKRKPPRLGRRAPHGQSVILIWLAPKVGTGLPSSSRPQLAGCSSRARRLTVSRSASALVAACPCRSLPPLNT